jgi:general secretion pathway protein K
MPAEVFASRVLDWRDPDDELSYGGAEAAEYGSAGLNYRPQNDAFRSVDDLQWLLGMSATDVQALAPLLTVYNPTGTIALFETSHAVLLATDVSARVADRIMALSSRRTEQAIAEMNELVSDQQEWVRAEAGPSYSVTVEVRRNDGSVRVIRAVLTASASPEKLYYVVDWQE